MVKNKPMPEISWMRVSDLKELSVVHRSGNFHFLCEERPRKRKSLFPKWWCAACKKYVLPDGKRHFTLVHRIKVVK